MREGKSRKKSMIATKLQSAALLTAVCHSRHSSGWVVQIPKDEANAFRKPSTQHTLSVSSRKCSFLSICQMEFRASLHSRDSWHSLFHPSFPGLGGFLSSIFAFWTPTARPMSSQRQLTLAPIGSSEPTHKTLLGAWRSHSSNCLGKFTLPRGQSHVTPAPMIDRGNCPEASRERDKG